MTKATTKEDGYPEHQIRKSADEEDDDKGRQQPSNEEGEATMVVGRRGGND